MDLRQILHIPDTLLPMGTTAVNLVALDTHPSKKSAMDKGKHQQQTTAMLLAQPRRLVDPEPLAKAVYLPLPLPAALPSPAGKPSGTSLASYLVDTSIHSPPVSPPSVVPCKEAAAGKAVTVSADASCPVQIPGSVTANALRGPGSTLLKPVETPPHATAFQPLFSMDALGTLLGEDMALHGLAEHVGTHARSSSADGTSHQVVPVAEHPTASAVPGEQVTTPSLASWSLPVEGNKRSPPGPPADIGNVLAKRRHSMYVPPTPPLLIHCPIQRRASVQEEFGMMLHGGSVTGSSTIRAGSDFTGTLTHISEESGGLDYLSQEAIEDLLTSSPELQESIAQANKEIMQDVLKAQQLVLATAAANLNAAQKASVATKDEAADSNARKPPKPSAAPKSARSRKSAQLPPVRLFCPHENCDKEFETQHKLRSHIRSHSMDRPYECQDCGTRFSRNHDLKRHQRIHAGHRPYVCQYCFKCFLRLDALNRHLRIKSGTGCRARPAPVELPPLHILSKQHAQKLSSGVEGEGPSADPSKPKLARTFIDESPAIERAFLEEVIPRPVVSDVQRQEQDSL